MSQPPAFGPQLPFTGGDSDRAYRDWKATCGPHAIAAACHVSLDAVRAALPAYKGWMNPTMVIQTLNTLQRPFHLTKGLKTTTLCRGINRIQWEGPWLNPGVPAAAAYQHTHWVAQQDGWVFCTATIDNSWIPESFWRQNLALENRPFHITHHYEIKG